ncbi:MAG: HIT domain-containing protein [Pseudomonadota bacterium]
MGNILWAPWRMEYILSQKSKDCIFCIGKDECNDKERLVLYRSSFSYVIMNRYPYNNGHIMIAPFTHIANIEGIDAQTSQDMFRLLQKSVEMLRTCIKPDGFNIGINLGRAAGAGIEEHLHIHIVPRWNGDSNFLSVLGDVRVMPEYLKDSYDKLYPFFSTLKQD